jgi:NAD(P)H-dependent FMN reductase
MKRLALNGSPRGHKSNSSVILAWIGEGLARAGADKPETLFLNRTGDHDAQRRAFLTADEILLVFPLYTDSVPGIVKSFLDPLAGVDRKRLAGKRFAFVVHSGFPESIQSAAVVAWLTRLCSRLGLTLVGGAIKGGSEGYRMMPPAMTKKVHGLFTRLGESLAIDGRFDEQTVTRLARPRRLNLFTRIVYRLLTPTGLPNFYWNMMLKKHGAWQRRFDRPYEKAAAALVHDVSTFTP